MKKILSSLFIKYLLTFIGIMVLSNIVSTVVMFLFFDVDFKLPIRGILFEGSQPISNFAFGLGLTAIIISAIAIFIAVKFLVKPIKQISQASKIVANGNFDVHVRVSGSDEIAQLAHNFNTMAAALSKNEYLHKDFVSNVSHEFKTPLTSLGGYAKLLKKPNLSEAKRQECLDIIIAETARLSKMTSNLLRLSELDNEVLTSRKEFFSLDEQIRDVLVLLQNNWGEKNLEIDLDMDAIQFVGDKALLYQVWVNLIGNAINYSFPKGIIQIRLYKKQGIYFELRDNGMGMTKESQERAFERFYKGDTSRNSSGTGLGLSICKKIIELHGGSISIQSEEGKGTSVNVMFN